MLVAAAFASAHTAQAAARALNGHGLRAVALTAGAQVLRQAPALTCVVCGLRLADMTAAQLRRLLPADVPMLLMVPSGAPDLPGVERLPDRVTGALLAERIVRRMDESEAAIYRAKRALIQARGLDEAQAHRLLQRRAMAQGVSMEQAARAALRILGKEDDTKR